ncbi:MarR family winged helix-turn-helix transcriptional regulator [Paenibacillus camerounensis]|uniref:MarR family winged helix-turn-helix transcriptional regulator n=1 Tax=Paenibacillus camerounensis TaxID=1243663 RepID=UPI0005AA194B|nr:MarR family transcriptional regulator [Paenibacillus camerounensis]
MEKCYVSYLKTTFLLRMLNNQLNTKFERATNFNLSRYELLHYLLDGEKYTQTHLQKIMNIDNAAITRQLKALEAEGYVYRERNPSNNREMLVQVTDKGKTETLECQVSRNNFNNKLFDDFTEEDIEQLLLLLDKMKINLEEI